jgi:hypothetical protein
MVETDIKRGARTQFGDREALHEMLVASFTLAMQLDEPDPADHILEALRRLHRDDGPCEEGEGNVGFS